MLERPGAYTHPASHEISSDTSSEISSEIVMNFSTHILSERSCYISSDISYVT